MNLVLFGPPGAGKGTQGTMLAEARGLLKISTGDILRDAVRAGTPLGREAQKFMNAGELVPDAVILGLVREAIENAEEAHGFIMDGFPRTIPQAEAVDLMLSEMERPIDMVVVLDVDDEKLVERISGRRSCPKCGAVYNVYTDPPAGNPSLCDRCGGELVQRADDARETVKRRLEVYKEQTAPILDYYGRHHVPVQPIDGDRPIQAVLDDIVGVLDR
jgi:adenylate kinase